MSRFSNVEIDNSFITQNMIFLLW